MSTSDYVNRHLQRTRQHKMREALSKGLTGVPTSPSAPGPLKGKEGRGKGRQRSSSAEADRGLKVCPFHKRGTCRDGKDCPMMHTGKPGAGGSSKDGNATGSAEGSAKGSSNGKHGKEQVKIQPMGADRACWNYQNGDCQYAEKCVFNIHTRRPGKAKASQRSPEARPLPWHPSAPPQWRWLPCP